MDTIDMNTKNLKKKIIYLSLISCLLLINVLDIHAFENGYNPYVFQIETDSTMLTGFISKEMNGMITSLHGVNGRSNSNIRAKSHDGRRTFFGLEIDKVDIGYDIALLTSKEIKKFITDGYGLDYSKDPIYSEKDYEGLYVIGYPAKVSKQWRSDLCVGTPFIRKLYDFFSEKSVIDTIRRHNSPNIENEFISIAGHLTHGHSGSPILNKNNKVIGVANGGLENGHGEICWAVPYNKINLVPKSSKEQEIASLSREPPPVMVALTSFSAFQFNGELLTWQEPRAEMMTWLEAIDYVEEMNRKSFRGYNDWRLPAVGELEDLAQFIKNSPGSYSDVDKLYWSSENTPESEEKSFAVNLGNARMEWNEEPNERVVKRSNGRSLAVRLVRSLLP